MSGEKPFGETQWVDASKFRKDAAKKGAEETSDEEDETVPKTTEGNKGGQEASATSPKE